MPSQSIVGDEARKRLAKNIGLDGGVSLAIPIRLDARLRSLRVCVVIHFPRLESGGWPKGRVFDDLTWQAQLSSPRPSSDPAMGGGDFISRHKIVANKSELCNYQPP